MTETWPAVLLLLMISPAVGSFLGVLVERLPKGQSILAPSACAACGTRLTWAQMIPIVSALALRHRCAQCGAPIPGHLIRIEIAALGVAVVAVVAAMGPLHLWVLALGLWCLVALFYTDLTTMRLPDPLTGAFFLLALGAGWSEGRGLVEPLLSGLGAALAFALIRWVYRLLRDREGMGLGDVKLAAGIGALLGWQDVPLAALIAASLALVVALWERFRLKRAARPDAGLQAAVPFGSYLVGATLLLVIL